MKNYKSIAVIAICIIATLFSTVSVDAATKKMTSAEQNAYSNVLWYKQYLNDSEHSIYESATYFLYDINNDGKKELIVSGPLGLRNVNYSMIYSYNGKKLIKKCVRGEVVGVSNKGIEVCDTDYSANLYYEDTYVYKVNKKLKLKRQIYSKSTYDVETEKDSTKYYNASKKVITKKQYNALLKQYKFKDVSKSIKPKDANVASNIIKTFNRKISTKLPNGKYFSICYGNKLNQVYETSPYAYKAKIEKNYMYIYGNISKEDGRSKPKAVGIYKIPIASNCKVWEVGGDFADKKHNISFFNKIAKTPEMLGDFGFTIKNGKIIKITLAM